MWLSEQAVPQAPQLAALVSRLVSQPLACLLLSQSPKPPLQAPVQKPPVQVGTAMLLAEQAMAQSPQLAALVSTLISQPLVCLFPSQSAKPLLQAPLQAPALH